MNTSLISRLSFLFVLLCLSAVIHAQPPTLAFAASAASSAESWEPSGADDDSDEAQQAPRRHRHDAWPARSEWRDQDGNLVHLGGSAHLLSGEHANSVVAVLGSATSEGDAVDVVSVLGNTRVTGPVHDSAVAVLGNVYVDSKIEGDVVAVLGTVELGPHADVDGDVVAALGNVRRDPAAVVHGEVQDVSFGNFGGMDWLHSWVDNCLLKGRPLAIAPDLGWAWSLAIGLLALYVALALLFRSSLSRCVQTLQTYPGHSFLAALIAMLLTPVLIVLLCVTVIGIAAVPFVVFTLFCLSLFGKAVMLGWIGHRIVDHRPGATIHPALGVLIGGIIVLGLYLIPVLGFLVYKILGVFGLGAVLYTLVLGQRARQAAKAERHPPTGPAVAAAPFAAATPGAAAAQSEAPPREPPAAAYATAPISPVPLDISALPRAGFWIRMGALLLDVLLIGILMHLSGAFLGFWHHDSDLNLLVLAIYGACMWKMRGSTLGGSVCDLRVVRDDGRPLEWDTAIVRALACFLSLAVCGLGFIWIAIDSNHQAWHDKIAGTLVLRVPKTRLVNAVR